MPWWLICRSSGSSPTPPGNPWPPRGNEHELRSRYARLVLANHRPVLPDRTFRAHRHLHVLAFEQEALRAGRQRDPRRGGPPVALEQRDPHTGHMLTGHEWNGITELNTPVPRAVYFFLIVTAIFSVIYWVLMPAWPLWSTYTKGLLGTDQRAVVNESVKHATLERAVWVDQIQNKSFADIAGDPKLMALVRQQGRTLFGDNCAACHGRDAKGGKGFPNLTTNSWLWGGAPEAIADTIRVGINSDNAGSRVSQMPAFGRDGMLPRGDIENVVAYVRSLSNPATDAPADKIAAGKAIYATNCASCHGDDGKGSTEVGAPNLTDAFWTYGGDPQSIYTSVWGGRQGHMPTWEARLSPVDRKILVLYLVDQRMPAQ